jgi:hypothetical protein
MRLPNEIALGVLIKRRFASPFEPAAFGLSQMAGLFSPIATVGMIPLMNGVGQLAGIE